MKTTMKSSNGYSATSTTSTQAKAKRAYNFKSPRAVKLMSTRFIWGGTFEVPAKMEGWRRPYLYGYVRAVDKTAGIRNKHFGVVINQYLAEHAAILPSYTSLVIEANDVAQTYGAKVTTSDISNYVNGRCQPKTDKEYAIRMVFEKYDKGWNERANHGWSCIYDKHAN